ncbi:hypothetical protein RF11_01341 [Thelohanellus kitauei]|uniref:Uncharacterized protein n=1 Tax=Thelohanellus kitauei TaxID=669202 RepID=A0A0C2JQX5_THEKT|nr:hypothetical protein RF11_01341 [Thelohanellus kitauei]
MIELKFTNDIPAPPQYLNMEIVDIRIYIAVNDLVISKFELSIMKPNDIRFLLLEGMRMVFDETSKRPIYPIFDVNITLYYDLNVKIYSFYEHRMVGWQIECKPHDPNALIDNPVIIYDDSWQDNDDISTMIELKFVNDVPAPPNFLNMEITAKSYNMTNLALVEQKEYKYNFVMISCQYKQSFTLSYGKSPGVLMVIKPHNISNDYIRVKKFNNVNVTHICLVAHDRQRFIFRLVYDKTSKRPIRPSFEVQIILSNDSNNEGKSFYERRMVGWQIECQPYDRNALIDNPLVIIDDSWQYQNIPTYIKIHYVNKERLNGFYAPSELMPIWGPSHTGISSALPLLLAEDDLPGVPLLYVKNVELAVR